MLCDEPYIATSLHVNSSRVKGYPPNVKIDTSQAPPFGSTDKICSPIALSRMGCETAGLNLSGAGWRRVGPGDLRSTVSCSFNFFDVIKYQTLIA